MPVPARSELVRLAIPRRVYTQSHIDYVVEAILNVYDRREDMGGYRITCEPPFLRHFTAHFEPIGEPAGLPVAPDGRTTGSGAPPRPSGRFDPRSRTSGRSGPVRSSSGPLPRDCDPPLPSAGNRAHD
jgi:hypothetical protein